MPSAMSRLGAPLEKHAISWSAASSVMRVIAPLPNCFSMLDTASSMAFAFASSATPPRSTFAFVVSPSLPRAILLASPSCLLPLRCRLPKCFSCRRREPNQVSRACSDGTDRPPPARFA